MILISIFIVFEKRIHFFFFNNQDELKYQSSLARRFCPYGLLRCSWTFNHFGNPRWGWIWGFAFLEINWDLEVFSHGGIEEREKKREKAKTWWKEMKEMVFTIIFFFHFEGNIYVSKGEEGWFRMLTFGGKLLWLRIRWKKIK